MFKVVACDNNRIALYCPEHRSYVCAEPDGQIGRRYALGPWEQFEVRRREEGGLLGDGDGWRGACWAHKEYKSFIALGL